MVFILGLITLIWCSKTITFDFININVFKNVTFNLSVLIYYVLQFVNSVINFIIPHFLQSVLGVSNILAGFGLLLDSLIGLANQGLIDALYDYKGAKEISYSGNTVLFIALVLWKIFTKNLTLLGGLPLFCFVVGRSSSFATMMTDSLAQLPHDKESLVYYELSIGSILRNNYSKSYCNKIK